MKYIQLKIKREGQVEFEKNYKINGFDLTQVTEDALKALDNVAPCERLAVIKVNGEVYRAKIDPNREIDCKLQAEIFVLDVERDIREKSRVAI